ncbi:MAG: DPP IV N-terminal domain-containing protein, partial [Pyrinomonadaceae bacterium]
AAGGRRGFAYVVALLVVCAAATAFGWYQFNSARRDAARTDAGAMKITRLTSSGRAGSPAISPDGKFVAHVVEDAGRQSLWLRQVGTNSNQQILPPEEINYFGLTFSPDGRNLYLVRGRNSYINELYVMPMLGGEPRLVVKDIDSAVTLSPDGQQLAFLRNYPDTGEAVILVANSDGTGERRVAARRQPDYFHRGPAWSPDGRLLACAVTNQSGGLHYNVVGLSVADGREELISDARWADVARFGWLPDGTGLVLSAQEDSARPRQIWLVPYPAGGGQPRRVTNDFNSYGGLNLTADASALVTIEGELRAGIWVAPAQGADTAATQVTAASGGGGGSNDGADGLAWAPDGRLVYVSSAGGERDLWVMNADGAGARQLTFGMRAWGPQVTPDGRHVVFASKREGNMHIWRVDLAGGNQTQLTRGEVEFDPRVSPDGRWIIYEGLSDGKSRVLKVSIDGGQPAPVLDRHAAAPTLSPDGKQLAYFYWDTRDYQSRLAIAPIRDDGTAGDPAKTFNLPMTRSFHWSPDGRAINFVDTKGGISNIYRQPLDGGEPRQLTNFKSDLIFAYAPAPDGRRIAVSRGAVSRDVVLVEDFK